jgi:hypothetical protein
MLAIFENKRSDPDIDLFMHDFQILGKITRFARREEDGEVRTVYTQRAHRTLHRNIDQCFGLEASIHISRRTTSFKVKRGDSDMRTISTFCNVMKIASVIWRRIRTREKYLYTPNNQDVPSICESNPWCGDMHKNSLLMVLF